MSPTMIAAYEKASRDYIEEAKHMDPEAARARAHANLIKAGVLDENGNSKKRIINDPMSW